MKLKILGFDSWTAGSHHFSRLVPALDELGFQLILIHVGSWGHDKGRPLEEKISGMVVRDILYYKGLSFDQILDLEKPAGILLLSTRAFPHMAFLQYSRSKGIPSCHLYHGLVRVQAVDTGKGQAYRPNLMNQLKLIIKRSGKNIFKQIPIYVKSLISTRASLHLWFSLFVSISEKAFGLVFRRYWLGTETSIGCVYTASDIYHMKFNYNISENNISVVGNPDLIQFGVVVNDLCAAFDAFEGFKSREVIYIDTALVTTGAVFSTDQHFLKYLISIRDALMHQGYRLVVKPHPAQFLSGLSDMLIESGLEICNNHDFKNRLLLSTAVITEPSTAAMIPALLGVPLFLSNLGPLADQKYGEVLTTYPMARSLTDLSAFGTQVSEVRQMTSKKSVLDWIKDNSGPLPASDMPKRVAIAIDKMVREYKRSCAV